MELDADILEYYDRGDEQDRLTAANRLELLRTQELLERSLPPAPAAILDVGGGPGVYAAWLAERGYDVVLIDPVPLHVEQARARGCPEASDRRRPRARPPGPLGRRRPADGSAVPPRRSGRSGCRRGARRRAWSAPVAWWPPRSSRGTPR